MNNGRALKFKARSNGMSHCNASSRTSPKIHCVFTKVWYLMRTSNKRPTARIAWASNEGFQITRAISITGVDATHGRIIVMIYSRTDWVTETGPDTNASDGWSEVSGALVGTVEWLKVHDDDWLTGRKPVLPELACLGGSTFVELGTNFEDVLG